MSSKLSALAEVDASGAFVRSASIFTHRIGSEQFPCVSGRYVLYVSLACPWACRTLSLRALKGLESAVPVVLVAPRWAPTKPQQDDHMGWVFRSCALAGDFDLLEVPLTEPVFQASSIRAVYEAAEPDVQHVKVCCARHLVDMSHPAAFFTPHRIALLRHVTRSSSLAPPVHCAPAPGHNHPSNRVQRKRAHLARLQQRLRFRGSFPRRQS